MTDIAYRREDALPLSDFQLVLQASGLAERRPEDAARLQAMLTNADLIVTARTTDGAIVGVARSITDWSYCLYCSDLAVDRAFQGRGIGKALLAETARLAPAVTGFYLLSAPKAVSFYEHAGYERLPDAFRFAVKQ